MLALFAGLLRVHCHRAERDRCRITRVIQENNNQIGSNISCILFIRNTVSQAMKNAIIVDCPWKGRSRSFSLILPDRSLVQNGRAACYQ